MNTFVKILMIICICANFQTYAQTADRYDFVVSGDGVWTWYNDERAVFKNDKLYTSYVKKNGRVGLSVNNIKTGTKIGSEVLLSNWTQVDDHNNAAMLARQDGKLMAFFSPHIREKSNYYRTSLVNEPTKQGDWSAQITQTTTNDSDNKGAIYNNAFQLSGEGGKIYNFMRTNNFNPNVKEYSSNGTPLNNGKDFILFKNGNGSVRPYVKYTSNNINRIDFFFTDGHPRVANNSLYHCYYQTNSNGSRGSIYQSDGTFIATLQSVFNGTPIDVSQVNKLYVFGSDGTLARAWTHNINYDANGRPVVTYSKQININNITYHYAYWTGTSWVNKFVSDAGRGLYNGEDDYTGIITTNPYNTNQIMMSSNRNPITGVEGSRYEIYSATTPNGGNSWNWKAITKNSVKDNLRPYVPKGITNPNDQVILWFYGDYITYTNYTTQIVAEYINRSGPTPPSSGNYNIDINTATSNTESGFTKLTGTTGGSATVNGVQFSLFGSGGIDSRNRAGAANNLVSDFAFVSPESPNSTLGIRVTGLPAGRYRFESYHFDQSFPAPVTVSIREQNGANIEATSLGNVTSPATFEIDVLASKVYEIVAQENNTSNRVRFNGLVVSQLSNPGSSPAVTFTNPVDGAVFNTGASIGSIVNVTDADGSISNVRLSINSTFVRQENFAPYTWGSDAPVDDPALNNLANGSYTLTAVATDNEGNSTTESISITVGSTSTAPIAKVDVNTATSTNKPGYTSLTGTNGASVTIQGVNYQLFGFSNQPGTTTGGADLTSDFAMNSSANASATPAVGFRISGLSAGTYSVKSWHYDAAAATSNIKIQVRQAGFGNPLTDLQTGVSLGSTNPVSYQFTVVANTDYDLVFRADGGTQARFNGIEITPVSSGAREGAVDAMNSYIEVFPNPFQNTLKVKGHFERVSLLDITGKPVFNKFYQVDASEVSFNTSFLSKGIYLLVLTEKSGNKVVKRLIRE